MLDYNASIQLDDNVRVNENFFVGRQWEGVESNGLPTPCVQLPQARDALHRGLLHIRQREAGGFAAGRGARRAPGRRGREPRSSRRYSERNGITVMLREFLRNAAVDGDAATYTYWDAEADAGGGRRGAVVTEIVRNTRVGFGNTAERRVEEQPYILIKRRELTPELRSGPGARLRAVGGDRERRGRGISGRL